MITAIKILVVPYKFTHWYLEATKSIPQILGGLILSFHYGSRNMGPIWATADSPLQAFEIDPAFVNAVAKFGGIYALYPSFFAGAAASIEIYGGLCLVFGCFTRITSFFVFVIMLVTLMFREFDGSWSYIPVCLYLALSILGMLLGSGKLGIDYYLSKRYHLLKE